jgi:hypothetical protein
MSPCSSSSSRAFQADLSSRTYNMMALLVVHSWENRQPFLASRFFIELLLLLLDPLSSPGRWLERISKVLCLVGNFAIAKLHNAHGLRWLLVIAEHVLGDPEIAEALDTPDGEAQLRRVVGAYGLNVVATTDSLARLRILDQDIIVIDLMFHFTIPSSLPDRKSVREKATGQHIYTPA